ncbi:Galactosyltransferase C-terminal [Trinorchestia longiramus]|nr:Galactosyltransferase C-terminal [Trinorchestia longiramus]
MLGAFRSGHRAPLIKFLKVACGGGLLVCLVWVFLLNDTLQRGCNSYDSENSSPFNDGHSMAVLVPLRDRFEELQELVIHLSKFLMIQRVKHHIFVVNQVDSFRFNRASLLNVGFLEAGHSYDYVALHDVDLLPMTQELSYRYPSSGPMHLAAPHIHPRYHYPAFIGGVLLLTREQFLLVNGLSNRYWGWGLEDDELYGRLKDSQLTVQRPGNLSTGTTSFRHIHDRKVRHRDEIRCYDQHLLTRRRDRQTGLNTLNYYLMSRRKLSIEGAHVTVLNVALQCDEKETPWCDCQSNVGNSNKEDSNKILAAIPARDLIAPKIDRKKHISRGA